MDATKAHYGPHAPSGAPLGTARGPAFAKSAPVDLARPYEGHTYYEVPPIKTAPYGWAIILYFFIGGIASAAQFIATIADLFGHGHDEKIVRAGRYLALAGALISPILLIADLHKWERWYNMLRIYRSTSAMSVGAWALSLFGAFSGLVAMAQFVGDLAAGPGRSIGKGAARVAQIPAAMAGGVVALYTGTLMAATTAPISASAFPFLSSLFASSAASSAAAALSIAAEATGAPERSKRKLNLVAVITGLAELIFALLVEREWHREGEAAPLNETALGAIFRGGVLGMGIGAPLVGHGVQAILPRESRPVTVISVISAISALVGGFVLRAVFVLGANESARRAQEYFSFTQGNRRGG